jgi:hypothetical protein
MSAGGGAGLPRAAGARFFASATSCPAASRSFVSRSDPSVSLSLARAVQLALAPLQLFLAVGQRRRQPGRIALQRLGAALLAAQRLVARGKLRLQRIAFTGSSGGRAGEFLELRLLRHDLDLAVGGVEARLVKHDAELRHLVLALFEQRVTLGHQPGKPGYLVLAFGEVGLQPAQLQFEPGDRLQPGITLGGGAPGRVARAVDVDRLRGDLLLQRADGHFEPAHGHGVFRPQRVLVGTDLVERKRQRRLDPAAGEHHRAPPYRRRDEDAEEDRGKEAENEDKRRLDHSPVPALARAAQDKARPPRLSAMPAGRESSSYGPFMRSPLQNGFQVGPCVSLR